MILTEDELRQEMDRLIQLAPSMEALIIALADECTERAFALDGSGLIAGELRNLAEKL